MRVEFKGNWYISFTRTGKITVGSTQLQNIPPSILLLSVTRIEKGQKSKHLTNLCILVYLCNGLGDGPETFYGHVYSPGTIKTKESKCHLDTYHCHHPLKRGFYSSYLFGWDSILSLRRNRRTSKEGVKVFSFHFLLQYPPYRCESLGKSRPFWTLLSDECVVVTQTLVTVTPLSSSSFPRSLFGV